MKTIKRWFFSFSTALVDWSAIIYLYVIVDSLLSLFVFIPSIPGILLCSLTYYVFCLFKWGKTPGMFILSGNYQPLRKGWTVAKELLTSTSVFLLLIYLSTVVQFTGIYFSIWMIVTLFWLAVILLLFLLPCLKRKIFRSKLVFPGKQNWIVRKKALKYYSFLWGIAISVRIIFYFGLDNFQTSYINPHTTHKYVDFLQKHRQNTLDYIFNLYDQYDHVILCERLHPEYTQWDLIYSIVSDPRFAQKEIQMFTEYGRTDAQERFKQFLSKDYANDTILEKELAHFNVYNSATWVLWINTNWFDFLKKYYYLQKEKNLKLWFTDGRIPWDQIHTSEDYRSSQNYHRDSLMAANIIERIDKDSIGKSFIIMNSRHALTKGSQNCGYYVAQHYKGKVANVLLNSSQYLPYTFFVQDGIWDCAFNQIPDSTFAFNFKDSPFGTSRLDLWSGLLVARGTCEDFFTGFIFYLPIERHFKAVGYPYEWDYEMDELCRRNSLISGSASLLQKVNPYYSNSSPVSHESLFCITWNVVKDWLFILFSVYSLFFLGIMWVTGRNKINRKE